MFYAYFVYIMYVYLACMSPVFSLYSYVDTFKEKLLKS